MGKTIKLAVFLAVISALSGLCLSFVNSQTAPIIAENGSSKETEYLTKIFENAKFTEKDVSGEFVKKQYTCDAGTAYKIEVKGYGADGISFLLGIDTEGQYVGYEVLNYSSETSGVGDQIAGEDFKASVLEATADDEVDTISGATISSQAVVNGINEAAELFSSSK